MKSTQWRTWLAIGNYAIIIGVSAVLTGLMVGEVIPGCSGRLFPRLTWRGILYGFIFLSFPLSVGGLHYAALVRRSVRAAAIIDFFWCLVLVVLFIPCFIAFVSYILAMDFSCDLLACAKLLVSLIPMGYFIFCHWANVQLLDHLRAIAEENGPQTNYGKQPFQFTLREIMFWVVIVSIMASATGYAMRH